MMRQFQLFLKKNYSEFYAILRRVFFPYIAHIREKRLHSFSQETWKTVTHESCTFSILLDPQNGFVDETIFTTGIYEADILSLIKNYVRKRDTVLDIGANIGQHSLFLSCLVGEEGRVHAIEPNPRLVVQMRRSIERNNFQNISIHECALGTEEEKKKLYIPINNVGGASIVPYQINTSTISINLIKGDNLCKPFGKISFIKMDVEGFEYEVLRGLEHTIEMSCPIIFLEYSPIHWPLENRVSHGQALLGFLKNLGYTFFDVEEGEKQVIDSDRWAEEFKKIQTNLLCVPKSKDVT